jgi:hypothetical protein
VRHEEDESVSNNDWHDEVIRLRAALQEIATAELPSDRLGTEKWRWLVCHMRVIASRALSTPPTEVDFEVGA